MTSPFGIMAEHALCQPLLDRHLDALRSEGISPSALIKTALGDWSLLLRDKVVLTGSNGFEFGRYRDAEVAVSAYIITAVDEFGEPADLVAWRPSTPPATWLGRVGLLGQELVYAPRIGKPLRIHETVIDWLRAGREGVVIINHARAAPLLRQAGRLEVETAAHRRRLEGLLTVRAPRIEVAAVWTEVTKRGAGGANNPEGLCGKSGKTTPEIVTLYNIQGDNVAPTGTLRDPEIVNHDNIMIDKDAVLKAKQGNSAEYGLRRLQKHDEVAF